MANPMVLLVSSDDITRIWPINTNCTHGHSSIAMIEIVTMTLIPHYI